MKFKTYLFLGLLIPILSLSQAAFSQAPNLGVLSSFAIFTAVGAISNVGGATHVQGDVGTNAGAFSGFTQGMITGQVHVADAVSAQAALDVENAYNQLFNMPCGQTIPALLGSGQTLTPGVYCIGGAASLTGNITFDGQNNPNAIFVVKINGAFSAAASSSVTLLNGASLKNIYWQIGGRADMATGTSFRGTIFVNGAIGLGDDAMFLGRMFSRSGALGMYNNFLVADGSGSANAPLPVVLTSFTAEVQGSGTRLQWTTASEKNTAYFAVERSIDGHTFAPIGRIAGQGNMAQARTYTWTDAQKSPIATASVYYRLRMVDTDNTASYSPVRQVTVANAATGQLEIQAYPNPFQQQLEVQIMAKQAGPATVQITDALGHRVLQMELTLTAGSTTVPLDNIQKVGPGIYLLQVQQGSQRQLQRLVRQ